MTSLSPQAQAVLDAAFSAYWSADQNDAEVIAAAALRAAADQVVPETELLMNARGTRSWHKAIRQAEIRSELLAIAAELEALPND